MAREQQVLVAMGRAPSRLSGNHQSERFGRLLFCSLPPHDGHCLSAHLGHLMGCSPPRQHRRNTHARQVRPGQVLLWQHSTR